MSIGLLFVTASVYQVIKQSVPSAAETTTHLTTCVLSSQCVPRVLHMSITCLDPEGLLWMQMLRGAEMLFAAIFSVVFLKRTLNKYNYIGIVCCLVSFLC